MLLKITPKQIEVSNSEWVHKILRDNIIEFILAPGCKISENDLSLELKVSRTPIREALSKLIKEKLVEVIPQKGTYVTKISIEEIYKNLFFRRSLEIEVLMQICNKDVIDLREAEKVLVKQEKLLKTLNKLRHAYSFFELDNQFHKELFKCISMDKAWDDLLDQACNHNRIRFISLVDEETAAKLVRQHKKELIIIKKRQIEKIREFVFMHTGNFESEIDSIKQSFPNFFE